MELFKAHQQWKSRPADERFRSVQAMHDACANYRDNAATAMLPYSALRVEAVNDDLQLVSKTGNNATLTHWSMGQLSSRAGAPASYIRELPATLAAQNINHGLKERGANDNANLLFHQNGNLLLRSANSDSYSRIWNSDITERLLRLQSDQPQWTNPMAYEITSPAKNGAWPTMSGAMVPSGLYASDHDMFSFLVDESKIIDGSPSGLNRGFFTWNSEVGASSFGFMSFLYDRVCGNNIVWGASNVNEIRIRHVGNADTKAFRELSAELVRYSNESTSEIDGMITAAKNYSLGTDKNEILDSVFALVTKMRLPELNRKKLTEAIDLSEQRTDRYGAVGSLWSVVGGLTEASQWLPHADERMKVDRAAGKLLKVINF